MSVGHCHVEVWAPGQLVEGSPSSMPAAPTCPSSYPSPTTGAGDHWARRSETCQLRKGLTVTRGRETDLAQSSRYGSGRGPLWPWRCPQVRMAVPVQCHTDSLRSRRRFAATTNPTERFYAITDSGRETARTDRSAPPRCRCNARTGTTHRAPRRWPARRSPGRPGRRRRADTSRSTS